MTDQSVAYEAAVLAARSDPSLREVVERAFLHDDDLEALTAFRESEDWSRIRRLLTSAGIRPGAAILDFGGGRGLVAASLAAEGYRATLCEINSSTVCGTGAAERLRGAANLGFEIATTPVQALPQATFHAVVCRAVLHHLEPLTETLAEVRHVLVPGGAFIASDEPTVRSRRQLQVVRTQHPFVRFGVDENAYRSRQYMGALRAAGFVGTKSRFPVSYRDYRRFERPDLPAGLAGVLYARYRLLSIVAPPPGAIRAFTAQRPRAEPAS